MEGAADAVAEAFEAVAVGVDDFLGAVTLGDLGEGRGLFKDVGGRVMQEHDEALVASGCGLAEGLFEARAFAGDEFFSLCLRVLVPADDVAPDVEIEGAFEGIAFGADEGDVAIGGKVVLQEKELPLVARVQPGGLADCPEHVVVAAQEDLAPGQARDEGEVFLTLGEVAPPGMVAGEDEGVLGLHDLVHIFFDLAHMVLPDTAEAVHGLVGLKAEVQIA